MMVALQRRMRSHLPKAAQFVTEKKTRGAIPPPLYSLALASCDFEFGSQNEIEAKVTQIRHRS